MKPKHLTLTLYGAILMHKVKLVGHLDVPEDRYTAVMAALPAHINLTRAEDGCISFEVTPCSTIEHRLIVNELFSNQITFDAHQKRTQASEWATITKDIDRHYTISKV